MSSGVSGAGSDGSSLDQLVAGSSEKSFADETLSIASKLGLFSEHVRKWLLAEPTKISELLAPTAIVSAHASFGHMKASVLMSCTCSHSGDRTSCSLHCDSPPLADIVFVLSTAVHPVFNDGWMCFANLLLEHCSSGAFFVALSSCCDMSPVSQTQFFLKQVESTPCKLSHTWGLLSIVTV